MNILVLFLLLLTKSAATQNIFSCNDGAVTFFSEAPLGNIDATSRNLSSYVNTASREIVFVVTMRSFRFRKALMEEHFNEKYAESDKYPKATYQGIINEQVDFTKDGEYAITSTGTLTIHGVKQKRTEKGKLIIKNGVPSVRSEFNIALKDYNIRVPKLMFEYVAETVKVNFEADYSLFKKEN